MYDTHTPAEWAGHLSLGVSGISVIAFAVAFADSDLGYFDPRPLLGRAGDRVLVEAVNARWVLERAGLTVLNARDRARIAACDALLGLLLLLNSPKGATR